MPLPMPTAGIDDDERQVLGERRVLEAVVHDDQVDAVLDQALGRRRRGRAPTTVGAAAARSSGSSPTTPRRRGRADRRGAARGRCRHSREARKPGLRPRPRAIRASAIAVGVLPAPPTTKLPTQMTGTGGRKRGGRAMRQDGDEPHRAWRAARSASAAAPGFGSPPERGRRPHGAACPRPRSRRAR